MASLDGPPVRGAFDGGLTRDTDLELVRVIFMVAGNTLMSGCSSDS
jgi:hypothetical protein